MKTIKRIIAYGAPVQWLLLGYFIFILLGLVFSMFSYLTFIPLLETLFSKEALPEEKPWDPTLIDRLFAMEIGVKEFFSEIKMFLMSGASKSAVLLKICVAFVVGTILQNVFSFLANLMLSIYRMRVVVRLRKNIYHKVLDLDVAYFSDQNKGDLMSKMTNDMQQVEVTAIAVLQLIFREPISIVVPFTFLFFLQPELTFFTIIVLPVSGFVIGLITKSLRKMAKNGQGYLGTLLSIIEETISGIKVIRAFNAKRFVSDKFDMENTKYGRVLFKMEYQKGLASPISYILGTIVGSIILYEGGSYVFTGQGTVNLSAAELIFYLLLYFTVLPSLKAVSNEITAVQRGLVSAERIFTVIDQEEKISVADNSVTIDDFKEELKFSNVRFTYDNTEVLKGIDLTIPKGKTVALVGPSGGGKSTLMDLVPRFYDASEGAVTIDGINIKEIKPQSLRNQMGVVTQHAVLFNDSIFSNVAFGKDVTLAQVVEACKTANAHEFIEKMEGGYETNIGDGGMKLSGGQRQRLTIARAVLKNPAILLLDEATSALDSESEKIVQESLDRLMQNRTTLVIAHRLSTIQNADLIVVLKDGQIAEQGTHEELVELGGEYHRLVQIQKTEG